MNGICPKCKEKPKNADGYCRECRRAYARAYGNGSLVRKRCQRCGRLNPSRHPRCRACSSEISRIASARERAARAEAAADRQARARPARIAAFWGKLLEASGGCKLWPGPTHNGYGMATFRGSGEKTAHRVAWTLANGPVPDGLFVLHRCDVKRCCNPDHLFLGTHADNIRDLCEKRQQAFLPRALVQKLLADPKYRDEIRDALPKGAA